MACFQQPLCSIKNEATASYWVATGLLALMMTHSAYAYLAQEAVRVECHRLGFPGYFWLELAVAKLLGVLALLARWCPA